MKNLLLLRNELLFRVFLLSTLIVCCFACSKTSDGGDTPGNPSNPSITQLYNVDANFNVLPKSFAKRAAIQKDGKIIVSGYQFFNRIEKDGSIDNSFKPIAEVSDVNAINALVTQADGRILVAGTFVLNNTYRAVVRLNADGSLDNSFNPPLGSGNCLLVQTDGKILVGGSFSYKVGNNTFYNIARLNSDGSLDQSFLSPLGSTNRTTVTSLISLDGGKLLMAGTGALTLRNGFNYNVVRMNSEGTFDVTYILNGEITNGGSGGYITCLAQQQDGKVLIGGPFYNIGSDNYNGLARLNLDGSLDKSFQNPLYGYKGVTSILVLPDQNILTGRSYNPNLPWSDPLTPPSAAKLFLNYVSSKGVSDSSFNVGLTDGGIDLLLKENDTDILLIGQSLRKANNQTFGVMRIKKVK